MERPLNNYVNPADRIKSFNEVDLGLNQSQALQEASRCLNCKDPKCISGCPIHNPIPAFIAKIKENNLNEAYNILKENSIFGQICSRVCSQEKQCEKNCVRSIKSQSISIGQLERYICDNSNKAYSKIQPKNGIKVAIIGSGPAGLSCAYELLKEGFNVTIYEKESYAGGLLINGIPEFRLPHSIVQSLINDLSRLGIKFILNTKIGEDINLSTLQKNYGYIYLALGANTTKSMGIEGENLEGVYGADEFLSKFNVGLNKQEFTFKNVVIVGGGNVAMDAARCAVRYNAENVYIVYRRTEQEMPARAIELEHCKEESIIFMPLNNPIKINGTDKVESVELIKMELGEPDESGRRRPIEIKGSNYSLECDCVVMALGSTPDFGLTNKLESVEKNKYNYIATDEIGRTNISNIYAGGDLITGPQTVVMAIKSGKDVANDIICKTKGKNE